LCGSFKIKQCRGRCLAVRQGGFDYSARLDVLRSYCYKAQAEVGTALSFDVHDDVRVGAIDTRIEKDESHPGKVVETMVQAQQTHLSGIAMGTL
jgi:hypothetical protein